MKFKTIKMAKKFLEEIADFILDKYKGNFEELTIILPNRRAGLFLEKYLQEKIDKPSWAPKLNSIDDFVFEITKYDKASSTDLIFELYEIYLSFEKESARSFEDFGSWGPKLLNDFNDIDMYLADYKVIFTYLKEARNLQKWNLDRPNISALEDNYLKFYHSLLIYYVKFKDRLKSLNIAYSGMAIRDLVESPLNYDFTSNKFLIAGFNALSTAEVKLFEFIMTHFESDIFWDADDYYLKNTNQEAGKYIRKNLNNNNLKGKLILSEELSSRVKKINISGLSSNYSQVKYVGKLLKDLISKENFNSKETAIVLADEELLFPLLNSLPKEVEDLNITMSYPFKKSMAYDLIINLFELYKVALRKKQLSSETEDYILIYHRNIAKILNSPLVKKAYYNNLTKLINFINDNNISYTTAENILMFSKNLSFSDEELSLINSLKVENLSALTVLEAINKFLEILKGKLIFSELDGDLLSSNQIIINQLIIKLKKYPIIENISTLKKLYNSLTKMKGIPFEGEPLRRLQIMGILETRALDFKNIIYLSLNEGVIPKSNQFHSFILPEIRREYKLPMPYDDDAIYSYHFYRSLQRAENIELIYNKGENDLGSGEMSRFAKQLLYELKQQNQNISISNKIVKLPEPKKQKSKAIIINKSNEIYQQLLDLSTNPLRGFSPTSLNEFKTCGLKFYFSRILKIKPKDEVEEEIKVNTRGTIIHDTLDIIFREEAEAENSNKFDEDFFKRAKENYKKILFDRYKENFKNGDINHGNNLLLRKLDEKLVKDFFESEEINSLGIENVMTEQDLEYTIPIESQNEIIKVMLRGSADRIDSYKGVRRIIDYKTGKVDKNELNLDDKNILSSEKWANLFTNSKFDKPFQLLTYTLLYSRQFNYSLPISPIIIGLKSKSTHYPLIINNLNLISKEIIDNFENELINLLKEILNKNSAFKQTKEIKNCKNCDFIKICHKDK